MIKTTDKEYRKIKLAQTSAVISLIVVIVGIIVQNLFNNFSENLMLFSLKNLLIILFLFFGSLIFLGFLVISTKKKLSSLRKVIWITFIFWALFQIVTMIFTQFPSNLIETYWFIFFIIAAGGAIAQIVFGVKLYKTNKIFGNTAKWIGIFLVINSTLIFVSLVAGGSLIFITISNASLVCTLVSEIIFFGKLIN